MTKKVLIIGGGIAGPLTAIALHKADLLADRIVAFAMPASQLLGLFPVGLD